MSYRPKYNDSENNKVDLPIDAETLAGHAVESSGVDSNTSTLPTTAQVKAYVDYLINILTTNKVDKSDIGYIELDGSSSSGTLTDAQFAEVSKPYCIIHWTNVWFYKSKTITASANSYYFRAYTDISGSTNIALQEVYMTVLSNKNWTFYSGTYNVYSKDKTDELLDTKVNISDIIDTLISTATNKPLSANQGKVLNESIINLGQSLGATIDAIVNTGNIPAKKAVQDRYGHFIDEWYQPVTHLYEHNIVLADSSDMSAAQNYVTFTILSSSNAEFDTYYKIADRLINDGITGIKYAKKASGRCNIDSSTFIVDVDFINQEAEDSYIETSVVGVYAWDDDPVQLKIVYSQLDERGANCIKSTNASSTYVQDTVVQIY